MTDQTAIVAEIRPGMKPALEKRLQDGPHVLAMTGLVAAPRLLRHTYRWDRQARDEPAPDRVV